MNSEGFNRLVECRYGRMLHNIHDPYIGKSLDTYGEFSEGEVEMFRTFVRPDDVVVEVGANIGVHTVWFAKATNRGGAVVAFEPQRLLFQTLCANLALNSIMNVVAYQQACGEESGYITVPVLNPNMPLNFGALELGTHQKGDEIPLVKLDEYDLPRCRMMKVDVEGMELSVLKGAAETIERCKPVLYVENDRQAKSDELILHIESIGYEAWWHEPLFFNPTNFRGYSENIFGTMASLNLLCLQAGQTPPMELRRARASDGRH